MAKIIKIMKFRPFYWAGRLLIVLFYVLFNIQPQAVKLTIIPGPIELKTKKDEEVLNNKV